MAVNEMLGVWIVNYILIYYLIYRKGEAYWKIIGAILFMLNGVLVYTITDSRLGLFAGLLGLIIAFYEVLQVIDTAYDIKGMYFGK